MRCVCSLQVWRANEHRTRVGCSMSTLLVCVCKIVLQRIVLRIPEPRSNDYSSVLHSTCTYWRYIPKPQSGVAKPFFTCLFLTETMHKILNSMWQSYMTSTRRRNVINFILANFLRNFRTFCQHISAVILFLKRYT